MATRKIQIIGGGVAGLVTGILLEKRGIRTVIYEKNATPGGNLGGWDRNGYHIDNCIHWLTGTRAGTPLYALWEEVGALGDHVEIRQNDCFYASESDGERVAFYRDPERTRKEMIAHSPADAHALNRFFRTAEAVARCTAGEGDARAAALRAAGILRYAPTSLAAWSSTLRSPLLAAAFTDYIGGEYSAYGLLGAYAEFIAGNADIPAGGSVAMAKRMTEKYASCGGELRCGAEVTEIMTRGDRAIGVCFADGTEEEGIAVVAACDPAMTFGKLLTPDAMPTRLLSMYGKRREYPVFSAFQTAIAVHAETLPFRGTTGFPIMPLLADGRSLTRLTVRPFTHEPSFAPVGENLVQVLIFQHENACRTWIGLRNRDPERYETRKRELSAAICKRIVERYPSLNGKCEVIDAWTPATYNRYFSSFYGAFMSFAMTGKALPYKVAPNVRGFRNIFLATQWQNPPGGLPGAAEAGQSAACAVARSLC